MFNESHWWHTEMKREQLMERLSKLPLDLLVTYAVGCATHASEVVRTDVPTQELKDFQGSTLLLDLFWKDYPQSVSGVSLANIAKQAEEVITNELGPEPDEKFLQVPGAEPLLWAVLYSLTLASNPTPVIPAYSALGKSYFAVYAHYANDEQAINEGRMHEVEKATPRCVAEIKFQTSFLRYLENTKSLPSNYSEISSCYDID